MRGREGGGGFGGGVWRGGRFGARRKRSASMGMTTAVLDELAKECDLVITGSGD